MSPDAVARALRDAAREEREARLRVRVLVQQLRADGASWSFIGTVLGVSRQAARQRFAADELV